MMLFDRMQLAALACGLCVGLLASCGAATAQAPDLLIKEFREVRWCCGYWVGRIDFPDGDRCYMFNSGISCRFGNGER